MCRDLSAATINNLLCSMAHFGDTTFYSHKVRMTPLVSSRPHLYNSCDSNIHFKGPVVLYKLSCAVLWKLHLNAYIAGTVAKCAKFGINVTYTIIMYSEYQRPKNAKIA